MGKIEFTMENLKKCVCPTCPCQADSACTKEKLSKIQELMQEKEMPESDMVPIMYCASGKTTVQISILTDFANAIIVMSGRKMSWRTENHLVTSAGMEKQYNFTIKVGKDP